MPMCEVAEVLLHEFLTSALNEIELSGSHYDSFDAGRGPTALFVLEAVWANEVTQTVGN